MERRGLVWAGAALVALAAVLATGAVRVALAGGSEVLSPLAVGVVVLPVAMLTGYIGRRLLGTPPAEALVVRPQKRTIPAKKRGPVIPFSRSSRLVH